jgi:hypothetical protein
MRRFLRHQIPRAGFFPVVLQLFRVLPGDEHAHMVSKQMYKPRLASHTPGGGSEGNTTTTTHVPAIASGINRDHALRTAASVRPTKCLTQIAPLRPDNLIAMNKGA